MFEMDALYSNPLKYVDSDIFSDGDVNEGNVLPTAIMSYYLGHECYVAWYWSRFVKQLCFSLYIGGTAPIN